MMIRFIIAASALVIVVLLAVSSTAQAQQNLGGLDLQGYCQARYDRNVHLIGSDDPGGSAYRTHGDAFSLEFRQVVQHLSRTIKDTKDLIVDAP
jgi:hypothetical protein